MRRHRSFALHFPGQSKIRDKNIALAIDENIRRLDISVDELRVMQKLNSTETVVHKNCYRVIGEVFLVGVETYNLLEVTLDILCN